MNRRHFLELAGSGTAILLTACGGHHSGNSSSPPPGDTKWADLSSNLEGELLLPQSAGYPGASVLANPAFNSIKPQAIAMCVSADDVVNVLAYVRDNDLSVTPRCGGHSYGGTSTNTGVVINVTRMNSIKVNDDGTATIGAGARLGEVYDQLTAQGVGIPAGTCPGVGIAGLVLGGGIGILDRQYGLTCDNLVSASVVTVDGRLLFCDETNEPDLFWALRGGGGGNFVIATSFTFKTHPVQDITQVFAVFSFADFAKVFQAWQQWLDYLPDKFWGQIYIDFWSPAQAPTFFVRGFFLGVADDAEPYWNDFLTATQSTPLQGNQNLYIQQRSYRDTALMECQNSIEQCIAVTGAGWSYAASSDFFNELLPAEGVQTLMQALTDAQSSGVGGYIILDHMRGAISRIAVDATAFAHRNALFSIGYFTASASLDPTENWANQMRTTMQAWSSGGAYVNYLDPLIENWEAAYYGSNYARLAQVKAEYDPESVFNMRQGIIPG